LRFDTFENQREQGRCYTLDSNLSGNMPEYIWVWRKEEIAGRLLPVSI